MNKRQYVSMPRYVDECIYCGSSDYVGVTNDGGSQKLCGTCNTWYKAKIDPRYKKNPLFRGSDFCFSCNSKASVLSNTRFCLTCKKNIKVPATAAPYYFIKD